MSSIFHGISTIFHPIFQLFGWLLAFFYGLIPNYVVAISLLTIVIMGALTPLTVKSTRSMVAMQKLQPEIKKLQVKYKGPENRQLLNEELMKLYREEGANPLGGCLPVLAQGPFLFILYSVIRGLSTLKTVGGHVVLNNGLPVAEPKYIPDSSRMFNDLVAAHGQVKSFGLDLSLRPFPPSLHGGWGGTIPFLVIVAAAVGLQYFQMSQLNNRNKKAGQAMPAQQQMIQRFMPVFFAYFYFVIPAAVVLYMIVSSIIRIITQDIMFRTGVSHPGKTSVRALPETEKPAKSESSEKPSSFKSDNRSKSKKKRKDR
jgi:YidC/Oxa1 family membrane protein insertase